MSAETAAVVASPSVATAKPPQGMRKNGKASSQHLLTPFSAESYANAII